MTAPVHANRECATDDDGAPAARRAAPPNGAPLRTVGLSKRYRGRPALHPCDLQVAAGEALFVLGPNGAGKSTLLGLCAGVIAPDAGEVYLASLPARRPAARAGLGFVPQALAIYPRLTVSENLAFFARVLGVARAELPARVEHGLAVAGLAARGGALAGALSLGMQRRLHFACAVLHRPRVLLLDEPTVGVDPQSRALLHAAIEAQRRSGAAIVCATHLFDEAEQLADRVLVMREARVCAEGTPAALRAQHGARDLRAIVMRLTGGECGA
jgi:ABC-2 type transport system ATP-binding protein